MQEVDTPSGEPLEIAPGSKDGNNTSNITSTGTSKYLYLYRAAVVALVVFFIALVPMINRGHVFGRAAAAAQKSTMHVAPSNTTFSHPDNSNYHHTPSVQPGRSPASPTPYKPAPIIGLYPRHVSQYRSEVQRALNVIRQRWDVERYPSFLSMMNVPELSWNIQKNKFIKMLLEAKASVGPAVVAAGLTLRSPGPVRAKRRQQYVLGFTGSSVTAGHDSYFNESFPFVLERRIAPVFRSLFNVTVVTRNHAMGNNPCYPYDACVATHIGDDVDLLAWEQSMNCGHDEDPLEMFARSALAMPSKPTVLYVLSGTPYWTPDDCKAKDYAGGKRPPLTDKEREILRHAGSTEGIKWLADNSTSMHSMTFLYATSTSPDGIPSLYSETAPMAQTVNAVNDYACYGPYGPNFGAKTPGGGAVWHPGKEGHELRGDVLAFFLLSMLDDALETVQVMQMDEFEVNSRHHTGEAGAEGTERVKKGETHGHDGSQSSAATSNVASSGSRTFGMHDQKKSRSSSSISGSRGGSGIPPSHAKWGTGFGGTGNGHRSLMSHDSATKPAASSGDRSSSLVLQINARILDIASHFLDVHTSGGVAGGKTGSAMLLDHPTPAFCSKDICDEIIPQCYTDYEPRMSHGFSELLVDNNGWNKQLSFFDVKAVAKGEARGLGYVDRKWIYMSSGVNTSLSFYVHVRGPPIQPKTVFAPVHGEMAKHSSDRDSKIYTNAAKSDGGKQNLRALEQQPSPRPAHATATATTTAAQKRSGAPPRQLKLFLCEVQKGFLKYPDTMDDLPSSATVTINLHAADRLADDILRNNSVALRQHLHDPKFVGVTNSVRLVPFKDYCYESQQNLPPGRHIVTITQTGPKLVNLAYVLFK